MVLYNMVFTHGPSAHLRPLATLAGLGTISDNSDIARFVQGGVVKTFRCAVKIEHDELGQRHNRSARSR